MADKLTMVVFSGELDRALGAFILATTAASMGMEVTMFFTFWGLNIIKKPTGYIRSKGIMKRMLNRLNRGGANRLPFSRFNMLGMGPWMMKKLMAEVKMPSVQEMIAMAKGMGVKMIVCTTSCGVLGIPNDAFIPEADTFAGAATFLDEAKNSKVTLFI
ncbi:MAG: DsrE/DsrF/DrsH-like family protein [Actinomycetota bacterium]